MPTLIRLPDLELYRLSTGDVDDGMDLVISLQRQRNPGAVFYCTWTQPSVDYTIYIARVLEGAPAPLPTQIGVVAGGLYLQERVTDARGAGTALQELAEAYPIGPTRPRIEIYREGEGVVVLAPVAEGVNP